MNVVIVGSELSSEALVLLDCIVSILLSLLRYVVSDVENSQEVLLSLASLIAV